LKTLLAFHMALYHLKLLFLLPRIVKQPAGGEICSIKTCPADPGNGKPMETCPFKIVLIVDVGDTDNRHMFELARRSADRFYRQIPAFVQANFTVKKLDEMAEYLIKKKGRSAIPVAGYFTVIDLINLLSHEYEGERLAYFKFRLAKLIEESSTGADDIDPEIRDVTAMGLNEFDTFIEILMAYRGKYHRQYITECLDSLLLKNKDTGSMAQARTKGSPRRFVLGSKLLEVILQLAVLSQDEGRFVTRELTVEQLLSFLRERYGLYIDCLPDFETSDVSITDRRALRLNLEAFKRRLREIGFYEDLSDAYVTQQVSPRYAIASSNQSSIDERQI